MSHTKHRNVVVDKKSIYDEEEQRMRIKDHRARKKAISSDVDLEDYFDDEFNAELDYLLQKNR